MTEIELLELQKSFGGQKVLDGLNLTVEKGELLGLIGTNGAGKTTTMRIIAGLLRPDGGTVQIEGMPLEKNLKNLRERIGYMPDFFGVYDNLLVQEYMEFYAEADGMYGQEAGRRIAELLERVGLSGKEKTAVDTLSRGMKQRLCLARALLHRPQLLLLDEPASGMEPAARYELQKLLKELREEGVTVLVSSHILPELAQLCTKLAVLENGKLLLQGNAGEITEKLLQGGTIRITVYAEPERAALFLKQKRQVKSLVIRENSLLVALEGGKREEAQLLREMVAAEIPVVSFYREESNLEAVFMKLMKGKESDESGL